MGTILLCIPRRPAFVETEGERFTLERHDPLEKREYVRFVVAHKDKDSHVERGVFQAIAPAIEYETSWARTQMNSIFCENGLVRT
jgi:hypothetical protein